MKVRKVPLRRCIGCNEQKDKRELVRIVANAAGGIFKDETGKAPGRGAYVCRSRECLEKAYKSRGLERSLKRAVPKEVYESLSETRS
ncbi:MAG: YlxR family protein [Veillonellaceae bacterium]|nr:YlxR family protein [Veillonellaceae bacterium]